MPRESHRQPQLFDTTPYEKPAPQRDYDPETWVREGDITWHASNTPQMPKERNKDVMSSTTDYGWGIHTGTLASAMDRAHTTTGSHIYPEDYHYYNSRAYIHPVRMTSTSAIRRSPRLPEDERPTPSSWEATGDPVTQRKAERKHPTTFSDTEANQPNTEIRAHMATGHHIPYINLVEDQGSVSFRSPRKSLSTWSEDVLSDPGASTHHRIMAEQFDLTVPVHENWVNDRWMRPPAIKTQSRRPTGRMTKTGRDKEGNETFGEEWESYGPERTVSHNPHGRNPESLSGETYEQMTIDGGSEPVSGQSELVVLKPKMKKKPSGPEKRTIG